MVKVNLNWFGQISNDLVLHRDFHNVIEDPGIPDSLLKDQCIVSILSFSVPVEVLGGRVVVLTWNKVLFLKKFSTTLLVWFAASFRAWGMWTLMVGSSETPWLYWKTIRTGMRITVRDCLPVQRFLQRIEEQNQCPIPCVYVLSWYEEATNSKTWMLHKCSTQQHRTFQSQL